MEEVCLDHVPVESTERACEYNPEPDVVYGQSSMLMQNPDTVEDISECLECDRSSPVINYFLGGTFEGIASSDVTGVWAQVIG